MMYRTPVIPLLNVVTAAITAAAVCRDYPPPVLLGWLALFVLVAGWRFHLAARYRKADPAADIDYWRHRFVAGAVATGCLWGLAGSIVFMADDPGARVFVGFVLGGMTAGAVVGNATYMPAFYGFALPAIMPMAMALFVKDDGTSVEMALLMLAFSAMLVVAGRNMHRWIEASTRLQIEREQLIDRLQEATATLEQGLETGREREQVLISTTAALNERTRSMNLLNAMVQRLQEATTEQELADIVRGHAPQIVPGKPGILFLMNNSQNLLTAIAEWDHPAGTFMDFPPDQCWALRRSHVHLVPEGGSEVRCQHLHAEFRGGYACMPLLGRGGIVGLLYIAAEVGETDEAMTAFATNLGLALANYRLREALRVMSLRDSLTGLFNRRYLEEALVLEFGRAARAGDGIGVIVGDLDHFKRLNDTFGHDGGDMALRAVAAVLVANVRKGDIAARQGGEEFVLVLPGADLAQTVQRAEELRIALTGTEIQFHGKRIGPVTMSMGVAAFPQHGSSPEAVLRQADKAMYKAKQAGRDRIVVAGTFSDAIA